MQTKDRLFDNAIGKWVIKLEHVYQLTLTITTILK